MRISSIQGTGSVYARKNLTKMQNTIQTPNGETQPQTVNFQGSGLKIGLGAAGALLGGLIIGGPVGAIVGLAAGLKGAQMAEDDENAKNDDKNKKK